MTNLAVADIDDSVFDASSYDLPIPKIDGRKATNLDIRFSGSGSLDRTSEDDLALLEAMRIGAPVRLIVTGSINGKSFRLGGTDDDEMSYACTVRVASVEAGRNPQPKAREIRPLTPEELERIVVEIGPYGPLVTFAAETGLRPCEWLALERRDLDRSGRVLYVEREHVGGVTKPYGKTAASRRRVPLTIRAVDALEELPPRIDTALIFPAIRGGYMNLRNWRGRDWNTAVEAAGLEAVPYVLRHTFASNALAAGAGTFELARVMGTSLEMIERTYGHLVRGADDAFRSRLDAFAANSEESAEVAR